MGLITHEDMLAILRAAICRHGGQTRYAARLGVSSTFLSRMLTGKRNVTGKVLRDLGCERVIAYRRRDERDGDACDTSMPADADRADGPSFIA